MLAARVILFVSVAIAGCSARPSAHDLEWFGHDVTLSRSAKVLPKQGTPVEVDAKGLREIADACLVSNLDPLDRFTKLDELGKVEFAGGPSPATWIYGEGGIVKEGNVVVRLKHDPLRKYFGVEPD